MAGVPTAGGMKGTLVVQELRDIPFKDNDIVTGAHEGDGGEEATEGAADLEGRGRSADKHQLGARCLRSGRWASLGTSLWE